MVRLQQALISSYRILKINDIFRIIAVVFFFSERLIIFKKAAILYVI